MEWRVSGIQADEGRSGRRRDLDNVPLENLTTYELTKLRECVNNLIEVQRLAKVSELADETEATGHEYLIPLARAMRHHILGIKPPGETQPSERLGYKLATLYLKYYEGMGEIAFNDIRAMRRKVQEFFNVEDYIFRTTHYDELDNGYFRRRS